MATAGLDVTVIDVAEEALERAGEAADHVIECVIEDLDTVVLACGGVARTELHAAFHGRVPELHLVGDAWAPRRLTVATREAWELARRI